MDKTLELVLKECFWGDYNISIIEAEKLLAKNDKEFANFLIMRIIKDSPFPSSRLISLFDKESIKEFIDNLIVNSPYIIKRVKLIRSLLFREPFEGYMPWKIN